MKKQMKKIIGIIAACSIMLSVTGCGETKKAEKAVENMFAAYANAETDKLDEYFADGSREITDNNGFIGQFLQIVLNDFDYEILSVEQADDKTVFVNTKITTTDMSSVLKELTKQTLSNSIMSVFDGKMTDDEKTAKIIEDTLSNINKEELGTVTNEINIKVTEGEDGKWQINADDNFKNALLGGLVDAVGIY